MLRGVTGTSDAEVYAAVLRQAAHDAVRAVLTAPPDSVSGSTALRAVTTWVVHAYGIGAVQDLAEELAVDLAEAFDALASVEGRDPMALVDAWFHDQPAPDVSGGWARPGPDTRPPPASGVPSSRPSDGSARADAGRDRPMAP
jgi:hypothetical protein